MRRAVAVMPAGRWPAEDAVATATLTLDARHRRRLRLTDDAGTPFLLDLKRTALLADGDGLALADGGFIRIIAAAEPVIEVAAHSPAELARLAWHLGNRHLPLQVLIDGRLRIADDPVIFGMLQGLGADARRTSAPFSPEAGAYHGSLPHGHEHGHQHGHGHHDDDSG
jgi:urease accessory protein